jgi:hypothetical protein
MGITAKCANGHVLKVKDEFAGKSGLCPHCRARVFVPMPVHAIDKARISDDEILGLLGQTACVARATEEDGSDSVLDAPGDARQSNDTSIGLPGTSAVRKTKTCAKCQHVTSVAFTHCPRCGTTLPECAKAGRLAPRPKAK